MQAALAGLVGCPYNKLIGRARGGDGGQKGKALGGSELCIHDNVQSLLFGGRKGGQGWDGMFGRRREKGEGGGGVVV